MRGFKFSTPIPPYFPLANTTPELPAGLVCSSVNTPNQNTAPLTFCCGSFVLELSETDFLSFYERVFHKVTH